MKTDIRKAIATFALGAALMTVVPGTFAQGFGNTNHDSLIQKIIQKFGLKEADVRSVFDSFHQDRVNQMKTKNVDRLTQLVKDSKYSRMSTEHIRFPHLGPLGMIMCMRHNHISCTVPI
jgi:hypothetical protein